MLTIYTGGGKKNPAFGRLGENVLKFLGQSADFSLSLSFPTSDEMRAVNKKFRSVDKPTDVLSFPSLNLPAGFFNARGGRVPVIDAASFPSDAPDGAVFLGDILICPDEARRRAEAAGADYEYETRFLFAHGMLHLLGFDHDVPAARRRMRAAEDAVMSDGRKKTAGGEKKSAARKAAGKTAPPSETGGGAEKNRRRAGETAFAPPPPRRAGAVAVIGRPNAGKSSLVNAVVGRKASIVSQKAGTTRGRIFGILNAERGGVKFQLALADTPGVLKPLSPSGRRAAATVKDAARGADAVLYVMDGASRGSYDADISNLSRYVSSGVPVVVAVTKCDICPYEKIYPLLSRLTKDAGGAKEIVTVSARTGRNVDKLTEILLDLLPKGEALFDGESYTDKSLKFMAAEFVREKALRLLRDEVPRGMAVEIASYRDRPDSDLTDIYADIVCERESHKAIAIGAGGAMIKRIGEAARRDIEEASGRKVNLQLFVKVGRPRSDENEDF